MEVVFRKATIEDVAEIVALCNECFDEETNIEDAEEVFRKTMRDKNQIYLIGLSGERVISHAKITIVPTMFKDMNCFCILNHVCVRSRYRRYHVATQMLRECEKISKKHGCSAMKLWSSNFRIPAHACYKKYGFEVVDAKFFSKTIEEGTEYEN